MSSHYPTNSPPQSKPTAQQRHALASLPPPRSRRLPAGNSSRRSSSPSSSEASSSNTRSSPSRSGTRKKQSDEADSDARVGRETEEAGSSVNVAKAGTGYDDYDDDSLWEDGGEELEVVCAQYDEEAVSSLLP
jgi:hypothetical protein